MCKDAGFPSIEEPIAVVSQALAAAAAEQARLAKDASEERARAAAEQKRLADQVRSGRRAALPMTCACAPQPQACCLRRNVRLY